MKNQQARLHPRAADLGRIVDKLNAWAKAPATPAHSTALRLALRQYQQAAKAGRYEPIDRSCCMKTPASKEAPPVVPGSFESFGFVPEEGA
ncbi:hypothetical protein [Rhodocyclus gracilis]|uniref:Uncharacterized protein n=1 Tax=Rhodocyclus tenuis TaxID=1066 RepID=A0A6L5JV66_RHOTE|nr:hypothetical protein [Rhodocyclus gracilis]MBK1679746.1 hypothetical protein [Rhodocyclus tenuis]MQY51273.1 hypothetical protein [Rhodocyclus gracilis]